MNPNKPRIKCEFKDACGLFAPACYDKRHANCKEYETRKRLALMESENKELKTERHKDEQYKEHIWGQFTTQISELVARAEKAENEADEIAEANERLSANWHKAEEAFGVASRKAREAEAKLAAACEEVKRQREALRGAKATAIKYDYTHGEIERLREKLAAIEKDLRERRLTQYELLLEHFPAVKAKEPELCGVCGGKRGLCLCLEGTPLLDCGIAERAKKKLPYGGQPEDENEKDG